MTSQDEITRTAERVKDALGAAAEVMMVGDSSVRTRRSRVRRARGWLPPSSAAASIVAIALVAVLVGQLTSNTGGPTISSAGIGPVHPVNSAPDPAVLNSPGYLAARSSVVKILGSAPNCRGGGRMIEGSGFVYAPKHVITDAHVVAGVTRPIPPAKGAGPTVTTANGVKYSTRVVFYDPRIDIAVLYVPGLNLTPLRFNTQANPGDNAVVAGYPLNHSFTGVAARIGHVHRAQGPDIYQTGQVDRQIYQIRAVVEEGNAGGPLLSPSGTVDGVVYAGAVGIPHTGFVLTAAQIRADVSAGATATAPVSTQGCT
jgi:S1-C subfamily serine protease